MSNFRRTAVLLLGLGLLGLLLFLKGRPESVAPGTTSRASAAIAPEVGSDSVTAAPPARPARETPPWKSKPRAKTDVLEKMSPGIMAAPAGAGAPYVMRDRTASAFFANSQIAIALSGRKGPKAGRQSGAGLHWSPESAGDSDPKPRGELQGRVSRMVGDPRTWSIDQKTYSAIDYEAILPGIDMTVESRPHGLKYTLYAQAGADLANLVFRYRGAADVHAVAGGAGIEILTEVGTVTENELHCWQDGPAGRSKVEARYVALGGDSYQIVVGDHDPNLPTTIDPTIGWSTYIGASTAPNQDYEDAWAIAVDTIGNVYVTGSTSSIDFPRVGAFDNTLGGSNDVFVTKIRPSNPPLSQIVWSTFLGGSSDETGYAITVDTASPPNVYVTGYTNSSDFPMAGNPARNTLQSSEVFVTRINGSGTTLDFSTFLGGNDSESGYGIAVDTASPPNVYVSGYTYSTNLTMVAAFDTNFAGSTEGFITKLDGSKLLSIGPPIAWQTYLGGNGNDYIWNMTIDTNANVYVTGVTNSNSQFPLTGSIFKSTLTGGYDSFITKVNSAGGLMYSTYVGGNDYETGYAIAVDTQAVPNIFITGYTYSTNLPTVAGSYQKNINPGGVADAFVIKVAPSPTPPSSQVVWCSYLGGSGSDYGYGINVDSLGCAIVSGSTSSPSFSSALVPGFDQTYSASWEGFALRFNFDGTGLTFWTYVGGDGSDQIRNQAIDGAGNVYVIGNTSSSDYPTQNAFQNVRAGFQDAFIAKIATTPPPPAPPNPPGTLLWSSYLGGTNGPAMDEVRRIEFDNAGNMYLTGITNGTDFPMAGVPFNATLRGDQDVFVSKVNPAAPPANQLVWTAYLGGTYWDEPNALVVDPLGAFVVVGGYSESDDFPHDPAYPNINGADGFITKINSVGASCTLRWSRFLSGSLGGNVQGLALDSLGDVYSTGYTESNNLPGFGLGGFQLVNRGGGDVFVMKHDAGGNAAWGTYFGGTLYETANAIQIDSLGQVVIGGYTQSTVTFWTAGAPFQGVSGGGTYDAFVSRFDSTGNTLNYSTFLGGGSYDFLYDLVVDGSNNIYVTGYTQSAAPTPFPTRAGALSTSLSGTSDGFVCKINPSLVGAAQLVWSTYLGGSSNDYPYRIRVDSVGSVYVAGVTYSPDFPLKNAFDNVASNGEAFVTRINNPTGSTLALGWSSFLGGSEIDQAYGMALGPGGSVWVVGYTQSGNFPVFATPPAIVPDSVLSGQEGFVTRIDNQDPNMPVLLQQFRMDGITSLPLGAWTNQTQITVKATVTDAEEDQVRLRVEIKPITVLFDGTGTVDSPPSSTGSISMLVTLPPGNEFHWRCRSVDQHNHVSPWNSFGANGDGVGGPPFINAGRDVGFDIGAPVVTILTPVNQDSYFTQLGTIALGGQANDTLSGVALVEWRNGNPPPGSFTPAGGTVDNWSVGSIPLSALSSGVNVITVRATDAAGNTGTDVITVTWDTSPPTLTITSHPLPPATTTTGLGTVGVSGTMGDNIGVTAVNWSRSGGGVPTTNGSGVILTPTTWNASIPLAPGTNTITVTAQDAATNNSTGPNGTVTIILDNTPPLINITTTSQTTTLTSFNIVGTASDASGIAFVDWVSNRGPTGTATGTTSWNTLAPPQVALLQGANIITFTAHDGVGTTAQASVTITRDVDPPVVTITNPPNAGSYTTATTPLTIGGQATDDIGILKVEWETSLAPGVMHATVLTPPSPAASTSWIAQGLNAVPLSVGLQVITVRVTDTSNRTSTATLSVTYSASAPSLVISNPPTANHVTSLSSIAVAGTATSAGANITGITVQNLTTGVFSAFAPTGLGTPSASFTGPNAAPVSLVQGTNTVEVKATDGTVTTTTTLTIICDPTVPAVTITGPTGGDTWAQGTAVLVLNGVASDNRGITQVLVSNTTTGVLDQPATLVGPPTSLTWSASIGLSLVGANSIVVTAKDEAGNPTTDTLTVTYDATLPDISITTPTSAPTFIAFGVTSITVGGSIGDNVGISTITWSNARNGASGVATGFPTWSAPSVPLDDGINVITVVAKDIAGNTRNDSITIYLDTAIPTVLITAPTIAGSYNTSQATISVGGSAADDIGVAFVTWTSQGVTLKSGTAVGTTAWSIDSIPLDPGNNTIIVTAHDGRNALSDNLLATSRLIVNFDSVKPTLTIQVPTPPTFNTTDTPVLVSGIAGDGVGVTEVSWVNTATGGSGLASGTSNWSALIPLTSGSNLINVKAKDAAGNTETKSITIVYDPAAPLVTVTSPTTAVSITTGSSPISIGGTAQDDVGLSGVTWSTGGVPVLVNTSNGFLDWSGPVTLSPGSNDVTFTATDTVGRTGTTRITIIYDPDAPTVTITTPTSDPVYLTTSAVISLGGVASDNLSVQSVVWSNAATLDAGTAVGVGLWNVTNIDLIEGPNDITVTVTDSVGNVSTDVITIIYDGTPPAIAITAPVIVLPATTFPTTIRPFDITGTASDNLGLGSITFTNDRGGGGNAVPSVPLPALAVTWTASVYLSPGLNVVTVKAIDQHGYSVTTSITIDFTPENVPPTINITAPSAGGSAVSATQLVDVSGTASDNIGVVKVVWKNNLTGVKGTAVLSVPVPPDADPNLRNWLGTIPLARGDNQIVVTVIDDADNKTTSTITVAYDPPSDGTLPGITIVNPNVDVYDASTSPLLITLDASDNDGIASVTWTNTGTGSSGTATFVTGTTWEAPLALAIGPNTIQFTAHDPSGNIAVDDIIVNFAPGVADIANPVVTITSHATGVALHVSTPTITLAGVASDNVLVADVVWLNAATSASGGADGTTTWDAPLVLVPGTNVITLRVYDSSGNTDTDQITINYSPPAPVVPAGHCGLLGVEGLVLAGAAWLVSRRRR